MTVGGSDIIPKRDCVLCTSRVLLSLRKSGIAINRFSVIGIFLPFIRQFLKAKKQNTKLWFTRQMQNTCVMSVGSGSLVISSIPIQDIINDVTLKSWGYVQHVRILMTGARSQATIPYPGLLSPIMMNLQTMTNCTLYEYPLGTLSLDISCVCIYVQA